MAKNESKYFNTALLMDEALLQLLQKKDFEYITIKELCKKAGVNRSTFYLHYENMNDLLKESMEMLEKKFYASFASVIDEKPKDSYYITPSYLRPYLEFVKENRIVYRLICEKTSLFETKNTLNKLYKTIFQPILESHNVPKERQAIIFSYYFGGITSMIKKWVALDCEASIEDMMEMIMGCLDHE